MEAYGQQNSREMEQDVDVMTNNSSVENNTTATDEFNLTDNTERPTHPAAPNGSQFMSIQQLHLDGGTQTREEMDQETIDRYAWSMANYDVLPPVNVTSDGETYWLTDGFHRVYAAKQQGFTEIHVVVQQGSERDALDRALDANTTHGRQLSKHDIRKRIRLRLIDSEWRLWSDHEIARRCGALNHKIVSRERHRMETTGEIERISQRRRRDGSLIETKNIGKTRPISINDTQGAPTFEHIRSDTAFTNDIQQLSSEAESDNGSLDVLEMGEAYSGQPLIIDSTLDFQAMSASYWETLADPVLNHAGNNEETAKPVLAAVDYICATMREMLTLVERECPEALPLLAAFLFDQSYYGVAIARIDAGTAAVEWSAETPRLLQYYEYSFDDLAATMRRVADTNATDTEL